MNTDLIRAIFQHLLSTQDPEVYQFLWDRFSENGEIDWQEANERMIAWQRFEGWIACHGLENVGKK